MSALHGLPIDFNENCGTAEEMSTCCRVTPLITAVLWGLAYSWGTGNSLTPSNKIAPVINRTDPKLEQNCWSI